MTTPAILNRTKTVTRRLGWWFAVPGMEINAVDKCMGLKKGQSPQLLARIRVISSRREQLIAITDEDVIREGLDGVTTATQFVTRFIAAHGKKVAPATEVNRIEFEYLD